LWRSVRDWRFGLAERIESIWDTFWRGDPQMDENERVVRDVVRDPNKSHDEMLHPQRLRCCSLGKWYREKKLEMSTHDRPPFRNMSDSMLFDRVSSPLVVMEEMTELRIPAVLWR
jgi:hypothetical protein